MKAVFKAGSRQYIAEKGSSFWVDSPETKGRKEGDTISFDNVVMTYDDKGGIKAGGGKVAAKILKVKRAPKIIVFKYKRRKNYKVKRGHKQNGCLVEVTGI